MSSAAVNIAIFLQGKLLLTQREDFHTWCLPGGSPEPNETLSAAAVREAKEETGLDVRLRYLVGLYQRPNFGGYTLCAVFAADVIGGALKPQPSEVVDARWFTQHQIPPELAFGQAERIRDAFSGVRGVVYTNPAARPPNWPATRQGLYVARDVSGLPRQQFYMQLASQITPQFSTRDVPAPPPPPRSVAPVSAGPWTCPSCNAPVDANFELCWQCGTARDGTPDPNFEPDNRTFPAKPNTCQYCGYSLIGLTTNRCPECGETFPMSEMKYLKPPENPV